MSNQPPRWASRFLQWYCKPELLNEIEGDALELFYERLEEHGRIRASLQYIWDILRFFRRSNIKNSNSKFPKNSIPVAMLKNYYFTALRNLLKHKAYFAINTGGLAIGIASFTFIALYVANELSYDRFHANHENIYRANTKAIIRGEANNDATTSAPLAKTLLANYPEVLQATRFLKANSLLIGRGNMKISENDVLFADSAFFEVFKFELMQGNPKTALAAPNAMVLSQSYARKYFGDDDPMGKQLTVDDDSIVYEITGIVKDIPANSHIKFDMMGSIISNAAWNRDHWIGGDQHVYVELDPKTDPENLAKKMQKVFYDYMAPQIEYYTGLRIKEWEAAGNSVGYALMPIADIHLRSVFSGELEPGGNITYIYIYSVIGLILLFIAIFNFVNLATAHSSTRAKEVAIRKTIGSSRRGLIYQFIAESVLVSFIATFIAAFMVVLLKPFFVELIGRQIAYDLTSSHLVWLLMLAFAVFVGFLAGSYPAFALSSYKPTEVMKGHRGSQSKSGWLRSLLVTLQFTASLVIIIGTVVIYRQIDFMLTRNLGFDRDQMVVLERPDWLQDNLDAFKEELRQSSNIVEIGNSETIPGKPYAIRSYRRQTDAETFLFFNNQVTYEHLDLLGLELVSGRFFSKEHRLDSNAVVLNETAANALGFDDPIGKPLTSAFKKGRVITIIGVVKDYNIQSLHNVIAPVSIELAPANNDGFISVKVAGNSDIRSTISFVEDIWGRHTNHKPIQYFFFDEEYQRIYNSETSTARILVVFAGLSIFVACLGLLGLITHTTSARKKEIGIRKTLGASIATLVRIMSSDTLRLILAAVLISVPLAYLATDYWLQSFADRIGFSPWVYVICVLAVGLTVCIAISYQTIKAALGNPIDSLRQE